MGAVEIKEIRTLESDKNPLEQQDTKDEKIQRLLKSYMDLSSECLHKPSVYFLSSSERKKCAQKEVQFLSDFLAAL